MGDSYLSTTSVNARETRGQYGRNSVGARRGSPSHKVAEQAVSCKSSFLVCRCVTIRYDSVGGGVEARSQPCLAGVIHPLDRSTPLDVAYTSGTTPTSLSSPASPRGLFGGHEYAATPYTQTHRRTLALTSITPTHRVTVDAVGLHSQSDLPRQAPPRGAAGCPPPLSRRTGDLEICDGVVYAIWIPHSDPSGVRCREAGERNEVDSASCLSRPHAVIRADPT